MFSLLVLLIKCVNAVLASPALEIIPGGDRLVPVGNHIVFSCLGQANNLKWFGPDQLQIVNDGTDLDRNSFIEQDGPHELRLYMRAEEDSAGIYSCTGTMEGERVEASIGLQLYKAISFDFAPVNQRVSSTDEDIVHCRVSGAPMPTVTWKKNGQFIQTGEKYTLTREGLLIRNVKSEDSGVYQCVATVREMGLYEVKDITLTVTSNTEQE